MTIDKFWTVVATLNWKANPNPRTHREYLESNFSPEEVRAIHNHYHDLYDEIDAVLTKHLNNPAAANTISSDQFTDLCSEIIGRGQDYFNQVLANPEIARIMIANKDFKESFSYCFVK